MARKTAKRPRRTPGTGTIRFKRGRERPYEACPPAELAAEYHSFRSYEEAEAHLDRLVKERKEGTRNIIGGASLVQDYLPMWLELKAPHVSKKTLESYTYYCEYACGEGGLGRRRLDEVTHLIAQRMVNQLAADGFQNTGLLKSVLYQAFDYAVDPLEYLTKNPFRKVKVPPIERKEGIALTKAQRDAMLIAAAQDDATPCWLTDTTDATIPKRERPREKGIPAPLLPFWHLTSRLAFRRGEADALKWEHVNLDGATVTIAATRGRLGKGYTEGKTKTKKVRTAPLPDDLVALFRVHKLAQMQAALRHGWKWSEQGYVFVDPRTGAPISVDHLRYRWGKIKKASGLPAETTIHDLRVTSLTILALDGVPANVRKRLSGHSTSRMDELYTSHADIEDVRRALG